MSRHHAVLAPLLVLVTLASGCSLPLIMEIFNSRMDAADNPGPREYSNAELNYRYLSPGLPYVEIKPEHINAEASLVLMRADPTVFFMIIAEPRGSGDQLDAAGLTEVVRGMIQSRFEAVELHDAEPRSLHGVAGQRFDADLEIDGKPFAYSYWVTAVPGSYVQLITWAQQEDRGQLLEESDKLFAGFHLLDPDRGTAVVDREPFGTHRSDRFGYSLDLRETAWTRWGDLAETAAEADSGGLQGNNAAFLMIPFRHGDHALPMDARVRGLLAVMDIPYPDAAVQQAGELEFGVHRGLVFKHTRVIDARSYHYRLVVVPGEQCSYLLAVWVLEGRGDVDAVLAALRPQLGFDAERSPEDWRQPLDAQQQRNLATLFNGAGLYLFKSEQYERAARAFEQAIAHAPEDPVYLTNAMDALNRHGQHAPALLLLDAQAERHGARPEVQSWRAWHLKQSGRAHEALEIYTALFGAGHRDAEDFRTYLGLLEEQGRIDDAVAASERHLGDGGSLEQKVALAELLQRHGRHDEAVRRLQALRVEVPASPAVGFALIRSYREQERPEEVLLLTQELIDREVEAAAAYFARALAQMELKRPREAKVSLERARELEPGNSAIADALRQVSGVLGEGDNSAIKQAIAPVELPAAVRARLPPLDAAPAEPGYGASYLYQLRAMHFVRGEPLRRTRYQCLRVQQRSAVARFGTLTFDYDPLDEQVFVNALTVHDAQGEQVAEGDPATYYVVDKAGGEPISHDRTLHLPVPGLAPGRTVCVTLSARGLQPREQLPFTKVLLADLQPSLVAASYLRADPAELRHAEVNLGGPESVDGGLLWWAERPQVFSWEQMTGAVESVWPVLYFADQQASWNDEVKTYLDAVQDRLGSDPAVQQQARELTRGLQGRDAKIAALAGHVQRSVSYQAVAFGRSAWVPNPAATTLARAYGDCKDHAVLLRALLEAVGIPSTLALVNNLVEVRTELPAIDQFNHMVLYIPGPGGGRIVDATDKAGSVNLAAPAGLAGRPLLLLDAGKPRFVTVPAYRVADARIELRREVEVSAARVLQVADHLTLAGYPARLLRQLLGEVEPAERLRWAQGFLSSEIEGATARAIEIEHLDEPTRDLELTLRYELGGRVRDEGEGLRVRLPRLWLKKYLSAEPVPERRTPFLIRYPIALRAKTTLKGPEGLVLRQPADASARQKGAFGSWRVKARVARGRGVQELRCELRPGEHAAERYSTYQGFLDAAAQAATAEWRLEPR